MDGQDPLITLFLLHRIVLRKYSESVRARMVSVLQWMRGNDPPAQPCLHCSAFAARKFLQLSLVFQLCLSE